MVLIDQLRTNGQLSMVVESLPSSESFEEMKDIGIIWVSTNGVINQARLRLCQPGYLGIDRFKSICMLGVSVDLRRSFDQNGDCSSEIESTVREG
jgi:hypothetical protein